MKLSHLLSITTTLIMAVFTLSACTHSSTNPPFPSTEKETAIIESENTSPVQEVHSYINPDGTSLAARINVPAGYMRIAADKGSFAEFVREYEMKPDNSPVLLYDGTPKNHQSAHVAVFTLPLEPEDLQQCADSVMRIYGEYYYANGQFDKIVYTLGGGFSADFSKWSQGYGISLNGNELCWINAPKNDSSYPSFQKFMRMVFAYSGTINLEADSTPIETAELAIGDIFIKGGSPGHVVMVADVCVNDSGEKAFLLAQGYMPAQEFHVIKNPLHEDDPWYYETELSYPLKTAEYTFPEGSLRRLVVTPQIR